VLKEMNELAGESQNSKVKIQKGVFSEKSYFNQKPIVRSGISE